MTTPTDRPDPGLPEAVARVRAEIDRHILRREGSLGAGRSRCSCGEWFGFPPSADLHVAEALALAARADYPDVDAIVRNAKAEALRDFADTKVRNQTPGRMAEDLHAEADRIEGAFKEEVIGTISGATVVSSTHPEVSAVMAALREMREP